jgi:hypothetical protein
MGRHDCEAGESPALSRNCNPLERRARTPTSVQFPHASRQGGGKKSFTQEHTSLSKRQGFIFLKNSGEKPNANQIPPLPAANRTWDKLIERLFHC